MSRYREKLWHFRKTVSLEKNTRLPAQTRISRHQGKFKKCQDEDDWYCHNLLWTHRRNIRSNSCSWGRVVSATSARGPPFKNVSHWPHLKWEALAILRWLIGRNPHLDQQRPLPINIVGGHLRPHWFLMKALTSN